MFSEPERGKVAFKQRCLLQKLCRGFTEMETNKKAVAPAIGKLAWPPAGPCCFLWNMHAQNTNFR